MPLSKVRSPADIQVGRLLKPNFYDLDRAKFSQVKIDSWNYTYEEKLQVIENAKTAFDELDLPPDADERADLDRKEADVHSNKGKHASQRSPEKEKAVPAPAASSQANGTVKTPAKTAKPGLSLIGKQKAKFAAEKRAASLPNVRKDVIASPRPDEAPVQPLPSRQDSKPIARAVGGAKKWKAQHLDGAGSSSDSSEDGRGRALKRTARPQIVQSRVTKKSKATRDYSSSSSDESVILANTSVQTFARKAPPTPLKLNGNTPPDDKKPDPEELRERYEELFPAYEQLSRKLAKLHQDAEADDFEQEVEIDNQELQKLVSRWNRWHAELSSIRNWFESP